MTTILDVECKYSSDDLIESFKLILEDATTINVEAVGDCCSSSYIYELNEYKLKYLIGKKYIDIIKCDAFVIDDDVTDNIQNKSDDSDDDSIELIYYEIVLEGENSFKIVVANYSNGYYSGWLDISTTYPKYKTFPKKSLIFVVGLPACGKSTFVQSLKIKNAKIYDDSEINNCLNIKKMREDLENGFKVVVVSALFCNKEIYISTIDKFHVNRECIITYVFEKDVDRCIQNEINRTNNERKINDIIRLEKTYKTTNYFNSINLLTYKQE